MTLEPEIANRHRFRRFEVSIPCTVEWAGHKFRGRIANISLGGAHITEVKVLPQEGDSVQIHFTMVEKSVRVQLPSKVTHTQESTPSGSFGVTFEERPDEVYLKLRPVLNL